MPRRLWKFFIPYYHFALAYIGALACGFPSNDLFVVGITGTKGKTTTAEALASIFEAAGYKTALAGTLRFKIAGNSNPNIHKMTMPGRFFLQRFLLKAKRAGCTHAIVEMTSEGAAQFRHKGIYLNALIVTNITPEHVESHGSYENYVKAKLSIAKALERSPKRPRYLVVNSSIYEADQFLNTYVEEKTSFSIRDTYPFGREKKESVSFSFEGDRLYTKLLGDFNIENLLAAATLAKHMGISKEAVREGVGRLDFVRGRMEKIELQNFPSLPFEVYVDYAHTTDSLAKAYEALAGKRLVCVLGGTGGGRDKWKRPEMGKVAAKYCRKIFLTDEDPYDENPQQIVRDIEKGIVESGQAAEIIMNRQEAIKKAIQEAGPGEAVIITGKGTDPFIMGPKGTRTPWDDATVVRQCLMEILNEGRL